LIVDVEGILEALRSRPEPPLTPRQIWDPKLSRAIESRVSDPAARSALHLWNDDLARAHELAQEIETTLGSCLHGTMHRREPDYDNARYWFRRVGKHPVGGQIREAALELVGEAPALQEILASIRRRRDWDALAMVDWCERAAEAPELDRFLRGVQARELEALARHCVER
jgi:hypothetical protein